MTREPTEITDYKRFKTLHQTPSQTLFIGSRQDVTCTNNLIGCSLGLPYMVMFQQLSASDWLEVQRLRLAETQGWF